MAKILSNKYLRSLKVHLYTPNFMDEVENQERTVTSGTLHIIELLCVITFAKHNRPKLSTRSLCE